MIVDEGIRNSADPAERWDELEVRVPPPRPRIAAGRYQARSASLKKFKAFGRSIAELGFDCFDGPVENGKILARVPLFVRLPGEHGPLSPNAKLARLFHLLDGRMVRSGRVSLHLLQDKLWRIEVGDAVLEAGADDDPQTTGRRKRRRLPEALRYSVVTQVIERLA